MKYHVLIFSHVRYLTLVSVCISTITVNLSSCFYLGEKLTNNKLFEKPRLILVFVILLKVPTSDSCFNFCTILWIYSSRYIRIVVKFDCIFDFEYKDKKNYGSWASRWFWFRVHETD